MLRERRINQLHFKSVPASVILTSPLIVQMLLHWRPRARTSNLLNQQALRDSSAWGWMLQCNSAGASCA